MTKNEILSEIKRTAAENGSRPLGAKRFETETGIRMRDWKIYWPRLGDAQREAGFQPNVLQGAIPEDVLFERLVGVIRELGKFPTQDELRIKRHQDKSFPDATVFSNRFGRWSTLRERVRDYCRKRGFEDVTGLLPSPEVITAKRDKPVKSDLAVTGFVYLIKSGKNYKLGKTNSMGRRMREFEIQLPDEPRRVHVIRTDDPDGIETYWHKRFAGKRIRDTEFFKLDTEDIAAFKRRSFQ